MAEVMGGLHVSFNFKIFKKLEDLDLSQRTADLLRGEKIKYVGDLVQKTETEILAIPTLEREALDEIKEVLAQLGLHLNMELPGWPPDRLDELAKQFANY
jgi:DNA-directed RNA polymerase subunit alpha